MSTRPESVTELAVKRCHAVTGLRREKAEYYLRLHESVWPDVLRAIERVHIRNFSIAVQEIDGELYLFSYYEYVGHDYVADMKRLAEDPHTKRWWRETAPCQRPLPGAAAEGVIWLEAKEVFHTS